MRMRFWCFVHVDLEAIDSGEQPHRSDRAGGAFGGLPGRLACQQRQRGPWRGQPEPRSLQRQERRQYLADGRVEASFRVTSQRFAEGLGEWLTQRGKGEGGPVQVEVTPG